MAISRRFVGELKKRGENSLFAKGGRYFQMKESRAERTLLKEKIKSEKKGNMAIKKRDKADWKIVEDSLVLYKNAMEKTGHLPPAERAKILGATEERIDRAVVRTYTPRAEKQSFAHKELSEMSASLSMERKRLKK